jgi:hypothetical protein
MLLCHLCRGHFLLPPSSPNLQSLLQLCQSLTAVGPLQVVGSTTSLPQHQLSYTVFCSCNLLLPMLQNLLSLLEHLAGQQKASCLPKLTAQDALQAAEMLAAAAAAAQQQRQLADDPKAQQQQLKKLKQHAGVQFLCDWLVLVLPEVEAGQQLQLLDCLAAVAQARLGECARLC